MKPSPRKPLDRLLATRGVLRTSRILGLGIHPRTLYALRDSGRLIRLARGLYRPSGLPDLAEPDIVTVAARTPKAVVCLISALSLHGLTTQIPHAVDIALPPGTKAPRLSHPPVQIYRYSKKTLAAGVETRTIDSVAVRVFSPAKTIADAFKFRNRIGLETALEALRTAISRRRVPPSEILLFARLCRVERIIRPYLEAIL